MKAKSDPRAPGSPWLMPYLVVKDAAKSIDFYEKAFGFAVEERMEKQDGSILHVGMKKGDVMFMFAPEASWPGEPMYSPETSGEASPVSLYVYVDDVDAFIAHLKSSGVEVVCEPETMFWGDRMATVRDLNGYQWSFATCVGEFDENLIPPSMR